MAVPTIDAVTPALGSPTGGQLIEVIGTGFQLVPAPPPSGPVPSHPPTVRVRFGSMVSPRVAVITDARLLVVVPRATMPTSGPLTLGELTVDVTVENIDEDGVLVPGEAVVIADAYTYRRPDVSTANESALTTIVRALLRTLKGEVLANTVFSANTDYDSNTATAVVEPAEVPALVLVGPALTTNTLYSDSVRPCLDLPLEGERLVGRRPLYMDLGFDLILITQSDMQLLNLVALITVVIDRISRFTVICPPPVGTIDLDVDWVDPMTVTKQTNQLNSNLRVASGSLTVVGFPFSTIAGVMQDAAQDVAGVLQADPSLQPPEQVGDNLPAQQGGAVRSPPP